VPAAAVIPAPIAYINVVAVKKLVVGFWACSAGRLARGVAGLRSGSPGRGLHWLGLPSSWAHGGGFGRPSRVFTSSKDSACSLPGVPGI
jgi:hypothetical protein